MDALGIKKEYLKFVKENTKLNDISGTHTEVITPFVDSFGESIGFSIYTEGTHLKLSDDGITLFNLDVYGINVTKKGKRKSLLESTLKYHNFSLDDDEIYKVVTKKELGQAIHDMTQVLLNVYDFAQLSQSSIKSIFLEDVKDYFLNNKEHTFNVFPSFSITGKSHLEHKFNFVFSSKGKNKLTRVHNTLNLQQVNNILAGWLDTTQHRKLNYGDTERLYIILSDEGFKALKDEYLDALSAYDITVLNFDNKEEIIKNLGA